jgi:hypothetical protein
MMFKRKKIWLNAYHTPWLRLGLDKRDALLLGVFQEIVPAFEAVVEHRESPRCDDLNLGV